MTVKKEDNGTWSVRCWYRDWRGDRKQKTKRGFTKLKDAKQWEREFLAQEQTQVITMAGLINAFKVSQYDSVRIGEIQEDTYDQKKRCIELYLSPYFKEANVENVSARVISDWLVWVNKQSKRGQFSTSYIQKLVSILSQIFDYGIKYYGLKTNPTTTLTYAKDVSFDERCEYWELDDYNKFYESLDKPYQKVLFNVLYWGGLRAGEVLGITPADINNGSIVINKQWKTRTKNRSKIASPKTKASNRVVILPSFVYEQLEAFVRLQDINPTDRVFPIARITLYKIIKKKTDKLGLPTASPHTLRHSYATNFLATSKDYVSAAAQLGHSSPKVTLGVYAHSQKEATQNSVDLLEKLHKNP